MKIAFAILVLSNSISFPVKAGVVDKALLSMIHYSASNQIIVNLFAHQDVTPKTDKYENVKANSLGHSYLEITNTYQEPVFVQGFRIDYNQSITIGLWGDTGSSDGPSVDGHVGIFVNREAYHYSKLETPDKSTMIMATVSKDKLPDLYPVCMEKAFTYDLLNYNFTTFATECWYLLTGQDLRCNSPYELRHKIMDVEDGVEGCYTMLETDCFYSYYRSSGRFLKYEPREER